MIRQFATCSVLGLNFGIEVHQVQEILRKQPLTPVPLASPVVRGLINLRGQIVTAIDLKRRLSPTGCGDSESLMNVIVQLKEEVVSLVVESVGDVLELEDSQFESCPETLESSLKELVEGVYKLNSGLLLVLNCEMAAEFPGA